MKHVALLFVLSCTLVGCTSGVAASLPPPSPSRQTQEADHLSRWKDAVALLQYTARHADKDNVLIELFTTIPITNAVQDPLPYVSTFMNDGGQLTNIAIDKNLKVDIWPSGGQQNTQPARDDLLWYEDSLATVRISPEYAYALTKAVRAQITVTETLTLPPTLQLGIDKDIHRLFGVRSAWTMRDVTKRLTAFVAVDAASGRILTQRIEQRVSSP